jgi:hypothetical protein
MTTVPRHWIVGGYTPSLDGSSTTLDPDGIGGSVVSGRIYAVLLDAQNAAKAAAAAAPGNIYVVYEAEWWAQVNLTPVALYPVGLQSVTTP